MWTRGQDCRCHQQSGKHIIDNAGERNFMLSTQRQHMKGDGEDDEKVCIQCNQTRPSGLTYSMPSGTSQMQNCRIMFVKNP